MSIKTSHHIWPEIEFVKEWPTALGGKKPVRAYRAKAKNDERWRWFLGFPEETVKPMIDLLETTLYWGEAHVAEHEGFYIWWLAVMTDTPDIPLDKLNHDLKWHLRAAQKCVAQLERWAEKK